MVLIRGETFVAGIINISTRSASSRWRMGAYTIQVYTPGRMIWSKKQVIIRNPPYTIHHPTNGQLETRIQFGTYAREMKGKPFKLVEGIPAVAKYIQDHMKNFRAPSRMREEDYPSKKYHTLHTLEELKKMLAERAKKPPVTPPATAFPP